MNLPDFLTQDEYGEVWLRGHRIGLMHVVDYYNEGRTVEEAHAEFSHVPRDLIERTLAYYRQNRSEVDAYIAGCHSEMDRQFARHRPGPTVLLVKQLLEAVEQADKERADDPTWAGLPVTEKVRRLGLLESTRAG